MLIEGVDYTVDWRRFRKGQSVFVPCQNGKEAKAAVRQEIVGKGVKVLMSHRVEEGIRGLRIWRI